MPHIYIGQWDWTTDPEEGDQWEMPRVDIGRGLLDLRSLPECADRGTLFPERGLFVLSEQDSSVGRYLGDDLGRLVPLQEREDLSVVFDLGEQIKATTPLGIILELFGPHADPSGLTRWKPLRGSARGGYGLYLAGQHLKWQYEEFDEAYRRQGIEVDHLDWLVLKAANLLSGSEHYCRVLTGLAEKYGITPDALLQKWGESWVQAWPTDTTILDDFTRGDSATLGSSSEGWSWTEVLGNTNIVSNKASGQGSATHRNRAESDLSSANHHAQAVVSGLVGTGDHGGVLVRYAAGADTCIAYKFRNHTAGTFRIQKIITGTPTSLAVNTGSAAAGGTEKVTVNSSDFIEGFHDGGSEVSVTDSSVTSNLRTGIYGITSGNDRCQWDDFEGKDLAVGGRTMGALAGHGGLAGVGGIAGRRGGIAG